MDVVIGIAVILGLLLVLSVLIRGAIRTFKRNAVVAVLVLIFVFPAWVIWAFIEGCMSFPDDVKKAVEDANKDTA